MDLGLSVVKLFPASSAGGPAYTCARSAGFRPGAAFRPDRRIEAADLAAYLGVPSVLAVGGSWMVRPGLLLERDWAAVGRLAHEASGARRAARGRARRCPPRPPAGDVPLGPRRARRGHAAARPGRGPDPRRPAVPGLGGRRRVQRRPRPAALLRPADRDRDGLRRQRRSAGWSRTSSARAASTRRTSAGSRTTGSAAAVRNGLNFTERGFGVARRVGRLGPRPHGGVAAAARATSTGTRSSARQARAGSTRAGSSPALSEHDRRTSPRRRWRRRAGTARSSSYDLNYRPSLWKADGGAARRPRGQPRARRHRST